MWPLRVGRRRVVLRRAACVLLQEAQLRGQVAELQAALDGAIGAVLDAIRGQVRRLPRRFTQFL
jgi:hypothetical protein